MFKYTKLLDKYLKFFNCTQYSKNLAIFTLPMPSRVYIKFLQFKVFVNKIQTH